MCNSYPDNSRIEYVLDFPESVPPQAFGAASGLRHGFLDNVVLINNYNKNVPTLQCGLSKTISGWLRYENPPLAFQVMLSNRVAFA